MPRTAIGGVLEQLPESFEKSLAERSSRSRRLLNFSSFSRKSSLTPVWKVLTASIARSYRACTAARDRLTSVLAVASSTLAAASSALAWDARINPHVVPAMPAMNTTATRVAAITPARCFRTNFRSR